MYMCVRAHTHTTGAASTTPHLVLSAVGLLYLTCTCTTVITQSDAVATIYFAHQFCVASILERQLFKSSLSQSLL